MSLIKENYSRQHARWIILNHVLFIYFSVSESHLTSKAYIILWWIEGNLPLMISMIRFWNKEYGDRMLNKEDEEVWCS